MMRIALPRGRLGAWLDRPAGRLVAAALALAVLAAPIGLVGDSLANLALIGDDFFYAAEARDWPTLCVYLLVPHNTHVVPLFRLWTYLLVQLAGRLANLQSTLATGSYVGLVVAMLAVGHFVARETGRTVLGLAAMAGLGITSVIEPAVVWYSAGQALWAGTAILGALLAAQAWRARGHWWWLALLVLGGVAAPAFWSGGLAAGPAVAAYLWADGRPRCRRVALALLVVGAAAMLLVVALSRRQINETGLIWERHPELPPRPIQAVLLTAQAIPEALILGNLGIDAALTASQGVVFTLALAAAWYGTRRGRGWPTPLEAAGAAVVLASFLLTYYFRGNFSFDSLRTLGWYYTIPQVGAMVFAAAWWAGLDSTATAAKPAPPHPLTRREALAVLTLAAALLVVHQPRLQRRAIAAAPPLTPWEREEFPIPELQYLRARYFASEHAARQHRFLIRLDRARQVALRRGIGRQEIGRVFGRVEAPGMPMQDEHYDALTLLSLPEHGTETNP
ncbi:MAG: hypothetical protein IRY99_15265, partial [Isosphaeraceae bacterium]|nr:hypothetical protein [Isosphaeraceae bacterium]